MGAKKKKPDTKFRTEDFVKVDSLHYVADNHGLKVMSFDYDTFKGWRVSYLKPALAIEPKFEECRDGMDYDLRIATWIKACTIYSPRYPMFQDMMLGEIKRLKDATD